MKLSRPELEADSWAFALDIYARPGVADACLQLQNEAGVDVMMFLMVTFAAIRHRILLTPAEIRELDEACRPWREQIVQPLRAIRIGLEGRAVAGPKQRDRAIPLESEGRSNSPPNDCKISCWRIACR